MKLRLFNELNFDPGYFIVKFFASKNPLTFLFKYLVSALSTIFGLFWKISSTRSKLTWPSWKVFKVKPNRAVGKTSLST